MRIISILVLVFTVPLSGLAGDSWEEIVQKGSGSVTVYWHPNNVNISESRDIIDGFEKELAVSFIDFLEREYQVDLELNWVELSGFPEILEIIKNGKPGMFGTSSISITEERAKDYLFTPPYLADIAVLVSSQKVPLANSPSEFSRIFKNKTAYSVENTTLLEGLQQLRDSLQLDFNIEFVKNSGEIIERITETDSSFGYLDLTNFLISFQNAATIRRQLFYPIRQEGLAMIYPKSSDWQEPVEAYFQSEQFLTDKKRITLKYFGEEIGNIIDQITLTTVIGPFEEILLSNKEKELQYQELLEAITRESDERQFKEILIGVLVVFGFAGAILLISNRFKSRVNRVLIEQQAIIEKSNEDLTRLNEEKNDLINVLAHDLRSPLANIDGCALLLKDDEKLDEETKKMVQYIIESSDRIQDMIAKILDVDAIDSQEHNMQLESLSPNPIVEKVLKDNAAKANDKNIALTYETEDGLLVKADRFYLTQVVENLINNAIKFSENDEKVIISLYRMGGLVRISVKDHGPGMTSEDKEKVFMKFQRLSSKPTAGESSVGLGLSIVKRFTEMMGGEVSLTSEPGKGSEFFIDLQPGD